MTLSQRLSISKPFFFFLFPAIDRDASKGQTQKSRQPCQGPDPVPAPRDSAGLLHKQGIAECGASLPGGCAPGGSGAKGLEPRAQDGGERTRLSEALETRGWSTCSVPSQLPRQASPLPTGRSGATRRAHAEPTGVWTVQGNPSPLLNT